MRCQPVALLAPPQRRAAGGRRVSRTRTRPVGPRLRLPERDTVTAPATAAPATPEATVPTARRSTAGLFAARFAVVGVWLALIAVYGVLKPEPFLPPGPFQPTFASHLALVF